MSLELVFSSLAEYLGKKITDSFFSGRSNSTNAKPVNERIEEALAAHLRRVDNWSSSVGFFRMPSQRDIDSETIPLVFSSTPRRFRMTANPGRLYKETDLLTSAQHLIILGPPGAGKTTTLKRIARFVLTQDAGATSDQCNAPILIRLREITFAQVDAHPLLVALARELGLELVIPERRITKETVQPDGSVKVEQQTIRGEPLCEGRPISTLLPKLINQLNPVLLLDGLDEVAPVGRARVESDIGLLVEGAGAYKVLITCRSGEYNNPIGGMSVIEVCDLQPDDITLLAERWLGDRSRKFLKKVENTSLAELSTRPLFLSHMLVLFDIEGTLPDQPFELYELIVMLMLKEWDRERKINRSSRYADFGPEKKRRFLSAIAYFLTYKSSIKIFTESDLITIYSEIHKSFGLPSEQARLVASEIESHTGLIVEAGSRHFEFSHLTLQEYLCAEHLVRSPFPASAIARFLMSYPSPLAIATALSTDPTGWLAGVLLNEKLIEKSIDIDIDRNLSIFLERLEFENPIFVGGQSLGLCILSLCFQYTESKSEHTKLRIERYIDKLLGNRSVRRSFTEVLVSVYHVSRNDADRSIFVAKLDSRASLAEEGEEDLPIGYTIPKSGGISSKWLEQNFCDELLFDGIRIAARR